MHCDLNYFVVAYSVRLLIFASVGMAAKAASIVRCDAVLFMLFRWHQLGEEKREKIKRATMHADTVLCVSQNSITAGSTVDRHCQHCHE